MKDENFLKANNARSVWHPMTAPGDSLKNAPVIVTGGQGVRITDIDGYEIDDFCLGDTGSMFGHSPAPVAKAIRHQARRGLTYMLPTEDALEAGRLLTAVFGDFRWQIATTATDANRFALRVARAVTGRPKVLVFNGCYHGTVDDIFVTLQDGKTVNCPGLLGQVADITRGARDNSLFLEVNSLKSSKFSTIFPPTQSSSLLVGQITSVFFPRIKSSISG